MSSEHAIANHWGKGDIYALIVSALEETSKSLDALTVNDLTPVDVTIEYGDGDQLPYENGVFDGAYSQHVTMNVADRGRFFAEAYRVLKPGAFFAVTEHGLGTTGNPHYPTPWS